ncbi:uncharacterized protein Dvir_GJ20391, isoform B [Drosophila virilis]|uniref:Uncharacterized protein, isoform B n=1 Tax=Drosophila virilis TaxID=7244 RepID=A0A0Q9WCA6_DROVI|nr:uncharacterized protein Dvir_GJ20391, isoform B [Drosophila virilis]
MSKLLDSRERVEQREQQKATSLGEYVYQRERGQQRDRGRNRSKAYSAAGSSDRSSVVKRQHLTKVASPEWEQIAAGSITRTRHGTRSGKRLAERYLRIILFVAYKMFGTRRHLLLVMTLSVLLLGISWAAEQPEQPEEVIKEDVIEIENKTQKVIRVSPLELPLKQDRTGSQMNSELFQIQTLRPGAQRPRQRLYVDSKRMRPSRIATGEASQPALKFSYTPELKAFPKQKLKMKQQKQQKQLHFPLESSASPMEALPVQMTPGPYPIYYVVSKTNGRFGKFPIKSFRSPAEFAKYLIKSKAEPIPRTQRFEGRPQPTTEEGSVARR